MGRTVALTATALLAACAAAPFGEVVIAVDTDVSVPNFVGKLRVDLYTPELTWFTSRDIATPDASSWPLSFSVYTEQPGQRHVRVRLRAYHDGSVRDYTGERLAAPMFVDPPSAHSLDELCAAPPLLPRATSMTFRHGAQPITELVAQGDCAPPTRTGSVAVRVQIAQAGTYHFAVVADEPEGHLGIRDGDTTLFLRSSCADPSSQLFCNDDIDPGNILTSAFDAALGPGEYFLISGGKRATPADLTLRWDDAARFTAVQAPPPSYDSVAGAPLTLAGAPTPPIEPLPSMTIDRLLDVSVDYGTQRSTRVLLRGECFGTQADLFGAQTCVDQAGVRVPVPAAELSGGADRGGASVQGTWKAERPLACGVAPRAASPDLLDDEVCVPGGAFRLGDERVVGLTLNSTPDQVAVVAPFLVDKYEYTVARYRAALAAGFAPLDDTPHVNDGAIVPATSEISTTACTLSSAPMGREDYPLNCVSWYTARALCQRDGGDLPSDIEWEYAATAAGRAPGAKTLYPWGDDTPDCDRTLFSRGALGTDCVAKGIGPQGVAAEPWASNDLSPLGVSGLGGSMGEWALDSVRDYRDDCWTTHRLYGVGCQEAEAPARATRGGGWALQQFALRSAALSGFSPGSGSYLLGLRCVRKGAP